MHIILLNKLRFDQISCSERSGTLSQYGMPKWYEIAKKLGTLDLVQHNIRFSKRKKHWLAGFEWGMVDFDSKCK